MANINFPNNPSVNDEFTVLGKTYKWDGVKWVFVSEAGIDVSDADALVSDVLASKTFYAGEDPELKTGTLAETAAPTITVVQDNDVNLIFTLTNNDDKTAFITYKIDDVFDTVELNASQTSGQITINSVENNITAGTYTLTAVASLKDEVARESSESVTLVTFATYELIADVNVTTATTQIDFDNLNITKDDELRLVYTLVGDTTSAFASYSLRSNDITSNYTNQQLAGGNTSLFPSRVNDAVFSFARSNRRVSGFVDVKVSNNDRFVFQSQFTIFIGSESNVIEQYNRNGVNTSTVTSITKLSVVSSRTNGIAVGSRLQLYKVNKGVA